MGGDNAPLEVVRGAVAAKNELGIDITLVGDVEQIEEIALQENFDLSEFSLFDAPVTVTMTDDPTCVVRKKKDSSMAVSLHLLSEGQGDAMVSTGNTGALFTGATLLCRKIKGIHRPAIASVLPMQKPVLLLDSGANVVVNEDYLCQFALMGSIYMQKNFGIASPKVGLLNNGAEECKGTPLYQSVNAALRKMPGINFVGNVEADKVPFGACDVLVADGFSGNIMLKSMEGMGKLFKRTLKGVLMQNLWSKVTALLIKDRMTAALLKYDSAEYGGAPILGVALPVIKAHGSSKAKAVKNAIKQAQKYAMSGTANAIASEMEVFNTPVHLSEEEDIK